MITLRRFLPAIANTPRRAAISTALIAGIAAGPLAGHATTHPATPTANPVIAAVTGANAPAKAPPVKPATAPTPTAQAATGKPATGKPATGNPAADTPAQAAQPAPPAPPPAAPAAPSQGDLLPNGGPGDQSRIDLDGDQVNNAKAIIKASKEMNLPPRAAVIAVATSLQETKLRNYGDLGNGNDHDSLGLFQQRPSTGWGAPQQLTDPNYSTKAFLKVLTQVGDWQHLPLTDAAQTVQVSAFGDRYAQWEQQAADIVHDNYNNA